MTNSPSFEVTLYDSEQQQKFSEVLAFQSRDSSGGFSIWPGQVDFFALAPDGISTLRQASQTLYIAAPQLLIEFTDGQLILSSRKIFVHPKIDKISEQLQSWLQTERTTRQQRGAQMKQFEQQLTQRLMRLEDD